MKKPIVIVAVFGLAITLTPAAFCEAPADYRFAYGYGRVWDLGYNWDSGHMMIP